MNMISKEALEFLEIAKEAFNNNSDWSTYRDEKEEFIALRSGFREDGITVYKLDSPVGIFTEQLPSQHKVLVNYDDLKKQEETKKKLVSCLLASEKLVKRGTNVEYNKGVMDTVSAALQLLSK